MSAVVAPHASPAGILRSLRGPITSAHLAYPNVLHVEVRDPRGEIWKLATQDADWLSSDPSSLMNHSVESAELDEETGELRLELSQGASLRVVPSAQEADDDPPNWKLFTPDGLILVFGPGGLWQFKRASDLVGPPIGREAIDKDPAASTPEALALNRLEERQWPVLSRLLLEERAHIRNEHLLLVIAFGLSIISIAVAAVSLALTLQ